MLCSYEERQPASNSKHQGYTNPDFQHARRYIVAGVIAASLLLIVVLPTTVFLWQPLVHSPSSEVSLKQIEGF
uniref:Uncharacterized protein n=1 Tax=Solanum lycopersicum TaxID=4081 RepID=A0A3Q7H0Y0_SOLLC